LANISDREAFIQEMIAEFGPPSEHKDDVPDDDEVAAVLKEMQGWSFTFSQERVDEIASFCNDFTESGFSQESPFDWISDITFVDTDMGGDEWIKKYGPERFAVLSAIQIVFSQVTEQMNAMSVCPECCSLSEDENGHLVCGDEGGKIEETSGGGEHWYWWRVGCNTCDFEWHSESDTI
jgi:hypothetical protein